MAGQRIEIADAGALQPGATLGASPAAIRSGLSLPHLNDLVQSLLLVGELADHTGLETVYAVCACRFLAVFLPRLRPAA